LDTRAFALIRLARGEFFSETMSNIRHHRDGISSWAELYERHAERVRRYVNRLVGTSGPASAEDLTQEVFVIAFKNWKSFRGSSSASTWLCGIAFNLARRHLSREASATRALTELAADAPDSTRELLPDTLHWCREQENAMLSAARDLPGTLQSAFVLHCLSGLSAQEAAAELGVSEGNLRVRVARARAFVKQRLAGGPG
jgi:RNA polymerase sigma-70 factor (ECF subfamily)